MNDKLNISLLGTSFTLSSDKSKDYLEQVYSEYRKLVSKVQNEMKVSDPLKAAILAGILATDEMLKEIPITDENDYKEEEYKAVDKITGELIKKIDNCLKKG